MLATSHRVRDLAYRLWEEQGRPIGRDEENWFEAERLLNGECDVEGSREGITKKGLLAVWHGLKRAPLVWRASGPHLAAFLGSADTGRFFVPA